MQATSAAPMLKECPTVPEEEQIPNGMCLAETRNPIFSLKGDSPAKMETVNDRSTLAKMSPPFSTIT